MLKLKTLTGQRMYYVNDLHKRYGPLVRIAPNQLASCSPDDFETIHRVGSGFNKTQWYEDWTRGKDGEGIGIGLFAMTDPRQAAARRRMFARALSVTSIRANCEDVVKEKVNTAVAKIKSDLVNGNESNVMKWWMLMASDVIGQLSFGESFEQLQVGKVSFFFFFIHAYACTYPQHDGCCRLTASGCARNLTSSRSWRRWPWASRSTTSSPAS